MEPDPASVDPGAPISLSMGKMWNAGPNAASEWYNALRVDSDPLVFIETIPNDATRRFVHQVLADSWIYAEEIGLRPNSLDTIAEGNFPRLGNYNAVATIH